jgi:hypothetical protein
MKYRLAKGKRRNCEKCWRTKVEKGFRGGKKRGEGEERGLLPGEVTVSGPGE